MSKKKARRAAIAATTKIVGELVLEVATLKQRVGSVELRSGDRDTKKSDANHSGASPQEIR